ncbi:carboxylic ester hydrolase [Anabrus simplex]|uniref:carboxylic ester hydrolase n=1 Tax=Anabrus simplex TaxID=316456 RepID=UPI0035A3A5DA
MEDHVIVNVAQGRLRGKKTRTKSGGPLVSFKGIPYAKPPVGTLRFKPPQPAEPWTGIRDALEEGPICVQLDLVINGIRGEEDCLYLNVYTPEMDNPKPRSLKPVMVWIHGGGFSMGSGNTEMNAGDYLVDMGVIVVTINYRLGPLGFLSLCDELVPGNMGLKDQVAALRWVQQNIVNFGGDPKNVTIFGESAGGASVHYQLLSPMSKGLFSKAIAQSGSALNPWAFTRSSRARAFHLGEVLGCKTDDPQVLLKFLMSVKAKDLVGASSKTISEEEKATGLGLPFVPTIEPVVPGQEGFLTREPIAIMREGKFHQVPLIAGVTSHEGMLLLKDVLPNPSLLNTIDSDFKVMVPDDLKDKKDTRYHQEIGEKIKKFYFGDKAVSADTIMDYVHLQSDLMFLNGVETMVTQQAAVSSAPIYYYQFKFDGDLGFVKKFVGASDLPGACHGDDLGYLFHMDLFDLNAEPNSPEDKMRKKMVKLWTNFAKNGNPTPELDADITVRWTPYTVTNPCYLEIDSKLSLERHVLEKERMDFWKQLYRSKL